MFIKQKLLLSIAAGAIVVSGAGAALAETTKSVTQKSSTVNPDGSVSYESHTVVTDAPAAVVVPPASTTTTTIVETPMRPVTFYYYDAPTKHVIAEPEFTNRVFSVWDKDKNGYIDSTEYLLNEPLAYEPVDFTKRTYQDVDSDGTLELTHEEYSTRLEKLPTYTTINTDSKPGVTVYEVSGLGFDEADLNKDGKVSYDEIKKAFYKQSALATEPALNTDK